MGRINARVLDSAGHVTAERHADGGRTDYGYNAFGDKTSSTVLSACPRPLPQVVAGRFFKCPRPQTTSRPSSRAGPRRQFDRIRHAAARFFPGVQALPCPLRTPIESL